MEKILWVGAGGAVGAVLRFLCTGWAMRLTGESAVGTVFVNVVGSFLMGVLAVVILERGPAGWDRLAPLVLTGVLGGFTTFSAFSLDVVRLFETGRVGLAGVYLVASVLLSVAGLCTGLAAARWYLQ